MNKRQHHIHQWAAWADCLIRLTHSLFILALTALVLCRQASADDAARHYHIPAQSLNNALLQFSASSGVEILFTADRVRGLNANGLDGNLSTTQALSQLLQGSGMTYRFVDAKTVTVEQALSNFRKTADVDETPLGKITVETDTGYDPGWANDPYNKDYTVINSSTATKTDTPIMDTPVSVQIVPRSVIEDQKAGTVTEALENVSGVRTQPALGLLSNVIVRGFTNQNIYRNGLKSNDNFAFQFDTANVQSIEVIKGPAQLYGRTEPGGLVNITTKKPLDIPYYSLEQRFGSYDLYRTEWDATGPLNKDKTLLYRFTGAYQNNNSFRDFVSNDRMLFAPSITWKPTDSTDATLDLQVVNQDFIADFGLPVIGKRPAPIPISRSLGDPNTPKSNVHQVFLNSLLNHRFNEDWAIHSRFLASFDHGDDTFINPTPAFDPGAALNQTTGIMQRNVFGQEHDGESYATNLDLTGRFNLGFSKHEVLLGFDFYRAFQNYGTKGFWITPNPALAINIFDPAPSYGIPQLVFDTTLAGSQRPGKDHSVFFNQWEGVYFQDQITL